MMGELYDAYQKYFEIVIADTPELKEEVYQIRYKVLCEEQRIPGFDQARYPDHSEKDDYDARSTHALLRHKPTGNFIGTVRLVLPDIAALEKPFPVEAYTRIDPEILANENASREKTVEISRFLVIKEFQRRKGDYLYEESSEVKLNDHDTYGDTHKDRRVTANITLILMAAVVQMSVKHDIQNWLSFMNPSLNRLLSQSGMGFKPIGPLVECHGKRKAYFIKFADILNKTQTDYYDVWEILTEQGKYLPAKIH